MPETVQKNFRVTMAMDRAIKYALENGWAVTESELLRKALEAYLPTAAQVEMAIAGKREMKK